MAYLVLSPIKMLKNKDLWRWGWQNCPGCGSYEITPALVCPHCRAGLVSKTRAGSDVDLFGTHRFLFDWIPGADDVLSNLILSLKGPGEKRAWDFWATEFLHRHRDRISSFENRLICAAPAKSFADDHASLFAKALAEKLGLPYAGRPLLKTGEVSSRTLSRAQRFAQHGFVKSTDFHAPRGSRVILVDDVLTTGATARAVKHVLRSQSGFEVWTFAARSRLSCGGSGPMIGI